MAVGSPTERVLAALEGVRRSGGGWEARCPVHGDHEPSLSVAEGEDGRALVNCHRGCDTRDVVAALGLEMRDLFAQRTNGRPTGKVTTRRYELRDREGTLVAVHVRADRDGKKRMWWELPDGRRTLDGLELGDLPLYGVDQLTDGVAVVFVVEGEKATEALGALVPTVGTVTGAEGCPADAQLEPLRGRTVVLWPDNDEPGRKHMQKVAAALHRLGIGAKVLTWPEAPAKGDAADFVAGGAGIDELRALYAAAVDWAPSGEPEPEPAGAFHLTDLGNAERLIARHGRDLRWCDEMGRWLHWDGGSWRTVSPTILQDLAIDTVLSIYEDANREPDPERRAALMKWAKSSSSARAIGSMVTLTKRARGAIAVAADELDADPMLLGVVGGAVDLRTGEALAPNRDLLVTKSCRTAFDPEARCPRWEAFLDRIFASDADLIAYVQRAVGYSLTGKTVERVVKILHGSGANGKTTFLEVLSHILGTYAMSTPVETLIAKKDRGIPNDVARLRSARFVSATESERGAKLAEAFIKAVTGGDRVTARFLHQEFFEFVPQFKLWLATNHRPEISGGGRAVWSRIRLIPFEVEIPPEERDPDLKAKLLAEAEGILAWAVRGCLEWQRVGLGWPSAVAEANRGYEEDEDVLGAFLEDRCVLELNVWTSVTELYESFKNWADIHGEERRSMKAFAQMLAERKGLRRSRQGGTGLRGFSGVRLRETSVTGRKEQDDDDEE